MPLQYCLFTPELQWQSRGKWRILQGCLGQDGDAVNDMVYGAGSLHGGSVTGSGNIYLTQVGS